LGALLKLFYGYFFVDDTRDVFGLRLGSGTDDRRQHTGGERARFLDNSGGTQFNFSSGIVVFFSFI
jgi:hypothetical protein